MKLIVCQGLPASGKTTWALTQVEKSGGVRVNQDDIRKELGWTSWSTWDFKSAAEKTVYDIKRSRIIAALKSGVDVISDDTNFGKRVQEMEQLARECGAEFELKPFHTPVDECIRRDNLREARVGADVILGMAAKNPDFSDRVTKVIGLPSALLCDLDGTLCLNNGHRGVFDYGKADEDDLCLQVMRLLEYYSQNGFPIVYMSGREEYGREAANRFFLKHGCPPGQLFMRANGDRRKDSIVKRELFDAHVRGIWNIEFVLDDRNQVVRMWRGLGLKCFQVAEGDF